MLDSVYILYQAKKLAYIKKMGSICNICKMDLTKNPECAEFHHVNNKDKIMTPSDLNVRNFEKSLDELEKCILLCSNCHRVIHFDKIKYEKFLSNIIEKSKDLLSNKINSCKKDNDKEVLSLYHKGHSVRSISKILGYSRGPINRILKQHKITKRKYIHPIKISKEELLELIELGLNKKQMSKKLKCSYATIHNMFNHYNLR